MSNNIEENANNFVNGDEDPIHDNVKFHTTESHIDHVNKKRWKEEVCKEIQK